MAMKQVCSRDFLSLTTLFVSFSCLLLVGTGTGFSAGEAGTPGPSLIQPDELVSILKSASGPKPLLIQVGFNVLYVQAHIPGSEFIGPGLNPDAIRRLHKRVEALPRTQPIVLYCGCCPWNECPNIKPAFRELDAMGFKNVKLLFIAHNFGEDWVKKDYPVAKGK